MKKITKDKSELGIKDILKRIFVYEKRYKTLLIAYLVLSVLNSLIAIVFASIINNTINYSLQRNQSELMRYIVEAVLVVLFGLFITYFSTYLFSVFTSKIMRDIRNDAVKRLLNLQLTCIENSQTGDLLSRMTRDMRSLQQFISKELFGTLISLFTVVITSAYLIHLSFKLFIMSFLFIPPVLYLSTLVSNPMWNLFRECSKNSGQANSVAQDSYEGIFIIKSFNLEQMFHERFSGIIKSVVTYGIKAAHRLKFTPIFNIILYGVPYIVCLIGGAFLTMHKEISTGQLIAFYYLVGNIVWPISSLPNTYSNIRRSMGTAQRFFEVIDEPAERTDGRNFGAEDSYLCARFCDVKFSYQGDSVQQKNILEGFNLELKRGSKTALVGRSGCGKSTVLKLLSGFYDNYGGSIELFDHDLKAWNVDGIRSQISYVSQETFLFPASIYENIRLGKPNATRDEIVIAARDADAHEFIMQLPDGYDTLVGERGVRLSGGQRQRISLARALLSDAPIMILDEPTSALDNQSESLVMKAMDRMMENRTLIVVTHRLSSIKEADSILVMDGGKIVESGTHKELIARESLYSQLYNRQIEQSQAAVAAE